MISLIAAMGKGRIIGTNNTLPWNLPADMKHFVAKTKGKTVVMGRKCYESIGKALPNRRNIILTRNQDFTADGCEVFQDTNAVIEATTGDEETVIIGGAEIYELFLEHTDTMYLTYIDHEFEGDILFPEFNESEWAVVESERYEKDEQNAYNMQFLTIKRKN